MVHRSARGESVLLSDIDWQSAPVGIPLEPSWSGSGCQYGGNVVKFTFSEIRRTPFAVPARPGRQAETESVADKTLFTIQRCRGDRARSCCAGSRSHGDDTLRGAGAARRIDAPVGQEMTIGDHRRDAVPTQNHERRRRRGNENERVRLSPTIDAEEARDPALVP